MTPDGDIAVMRIGVAVATGLFVWTLFHILSLVRYVAEYGITSATVTSSTDAQNGNKD